jgi:cobalt/nickel transport system permease protein/cobalt/nickel transport protein
MAHGFSFVKLRVLRGGKNLLLMALFLAVLVTPSFAQEEEKPKWPGVDETVVEKYAKELGREARAPFFDTDQGDLLLFLFALAGGIGGFVMGYYWHKVFVAGKKDREE